MTKRLLIRALSRAFCLHSQQIKSFAAHTAPSATKAPSQRSALTEAAGQMLPTLNLLLLPAADAARRISEVHLKV